MGLGPPTPEIYIPRWLTPVFRAAVEEHPVVVLTGARQVGKSTLLRHATPFDTWRYRTFDDLDARAMAEEQPDALWAGTRTIVLDEVQKVPSVLEAVKQTVDTDRGRRFVLSGSANLLLMRGVGESLAGRAVYFVLEPMTLGEIRRVEPPDLLTRALDGRLFGQQAPSEGPLPGLEEPADPMPWLWRGLMPATLPLSEQGVLRWLEGYVATYLERDLRELTEVASLVDFRRFMGLLALRGGQILNQTELGRDAGLSQPTIHRYLNLLESTHLLHRVSPWAASRTKRLMKRPRAYWADPGLASFLAGYYGAHAVGESRELGFFFETFVLLHLRVLASLMTPKAQIYGWRTHRGDEVDFVVERGRQVVAIEIKHRPKVGFRHTGGLRRFLEDHPRASGGLLVYSGNEILRLGEKILAVPWPMLTGGMTRAGQIDGE